MAKCVSYALSFREGVGTLGAYRNGGTYACIVNDPYAEVSEVLVDRIDRALAAGVVLVEVKEPVLANFRAANKPASFVIARRDDEVLEFFVAGGCEVAYLDGGELVRVSGEGCYPGVQGGFQCLSSVALLSGASSVPDEHIAQCLGGGLGARSIAEAADGHEEIIVEILDFKEKYYD